MLNSLKKDFYKFLKWLEKYVQTDMIYLSKGTFLLMTEKVFSLFASFVLSIILANFLMPDSYGIYKYVLSWIGVFAIFSLNGIDLATFQSTARGFENSFYSGFKTKFKWGFLGSLGILALSFYYWYHKNFILSTLFLISAVFLPLMNASSLYSSFLAGKKLFNYQIKYSIITHFVSVFFLILTVAITKNIFLLISVYLFTHTLLNSIFYIITQNKFKPNKNNDPQTIPYGKHISLINVIPSITSYIDKILLFTFIDSTQLAIYSFALTIPEKIKEMLQNINTLAFPKLANKTRQEIKKSLKKKLFQLFILTILVMISYFFFSPYIYKIFFPKYLSAIPYSRALALIFLTYPASFIITIFKAKAMTKELYRWNTINSIFYIIILLILLPLFGIWGVIAATISAKIFSLIFTLILAKKI